METIRVLSLSSANDQTMIVIARKVSGYKDEIQAGWLGTDEGAEAMKVDRRYFYVHDQRVGE